MPKFSNYYKNLTYTSSNKSTVIDKVVSFVITLYILLLLMSIFAKYSKSNLLKYITSETCSQISDVLNFFGLDFANFFITFWFIWILRTTFKNIKGISTAGKTLEKKLVSENLSDIEQTKEKQALSRAIAVKIFVEILHCLIILLFSFCCHWSVLTCVSPFKEIYYVFTDKQTVGQAFYHIINHKVYQNYTHLAPYEVDIRLGRVK